MKQNEKTKALQEEIRTLKAEKKELACRLSGLSSTLIQVLKVKSLRGCEVKNWVGFQNGNGTDVGQDIDIVVADVTKQPYLSVARFSGGCRVNGVFYAYVLQRDILVREDWLKAYSAMDYDKFIAAVKTGAKQELPTCRTCKHRQRWELNDHSTKIVQSCALQKSRRTGNGLKRIKVTNPACRLYEKE